MKKITIAIDGYSSCGKSTLAKDLAITLQYAHIDSGAMYRAVTLFMIDHDINVEDVDLVVENLSRVKVEFKFVGGANCTFLNDRNVESEIRKLRVSEKVSQIAVIAEVRHAMVALQRQMGQTKGIIMDGRDIGTVVFPNAELKLFLTADEKVRVERRFQELREKGHTITREEVKANLIQRDYIDTNRAESPLRQAEDAILFNNTHITRKEQLAMISALAKERIKSLAIADE